MGEGLRYNNGKVSLRVLSPLVQELEARVTMYGSYKYNDNNFKFFKKNDQDAYNEFMDCALRHIAAMRKGEVFDQESKQPHAVHAIWNLGRIMDLYYYGNNHMKDGKDLYEQPYTRELPPIASMDNFEEIWGMIPRSGGKKSEKLKEEEK